MKVQINYKNRFNLRIQTRERNVDVSKLPRLSGGAVGVVAVVGAAAGRAARIRAAAGSTAAEGLSVLVILN